MNTCLSIERLLLKREKNGFRFTLQVPRLEVLAGQTLAVIGQSGCGKSTLLDILALILSPTSINTFKLHSADGRAIDLNRASPAFLAGLRGSEIGYVLQSGGLLSFLSVRDNILLPGKFLGMPLEKLERRVEQLARWLNIAEQLDKKPQHLSGGQRQRVAIARSLIHSPRIVFADEPTAAVDQETAREIFAIFKEMARRMQTALVVVSHDRDLVYEFADRIVTFSLERGENSVISTLVETDFCGGGQHEG